MNTMSDASPRWIALTVLAAFTVAAGAWVLYAEHTLVGYALLLAGGVGFAAMWVWRTEATKHALRAILWGLIWFVTGGGSFRNPRR
jgi:hypothetical protein